DVAALGVGDAAIGIDRAAEILARARRHIDILQIDREARRRLPRAMAVGPGPHAVAEPEQEAGHLAAVAEPDPLESGAAHRPIGRAAQEDALIAARTDQIGDRQRTDITLTLEDVRMDAFARPAQAADDDVAQGHVGTVAVAAGDIDRIP